MFYVYQLKANEQVFYVGKGSKGRKDAHVKIAKWNGVDKMKNRKLYNKIKFLLDKGVEVTSEVIHSSDDEQECLKKEVEVISKIGLENLCNLTLGGEGTSGFRPTEETKRKMSLAQSGHSVSEEVRDKISNSMKGHKGYWKGRSLSEETRKKMSEAAKARQKK